jgi:hypothetical protein
LTNDGSKHVEDYSFTNTAKSNLDYKCDSNNGRFVMMNYRYDILPWLEQDVLPFCYNKDQSLISGLNQYISFFKYRYNLTKELMEINIKLANMINDKFENEGKNNNVEKYQYINELEESVCRAIGEYKMRIKNEILKKDVLEKIKNDISIFDSDLQFNEEIIDDKPNNCIYFRICKNKKFWRTMCIIVGFFNINLFVQISRRDNTNTNVFPIDNMKFDCLESDKHTYFGSKLWNSDVFGKDLKIDELKLKIKNICNEIKIKDQNIMNVKSSIMSIDTDKK